MESIVKRATCSTDYKGLTAPERQIFRSVLDDLVERGIFKLADCPAISSYARNVNLARKAAEDIEKYGTLLKQEDKYHGEIIKENPAVGIMQRAQKAAEDTALRLGLTPWGRKKMKSEEIAPKSDLDTWLDENN